MVLKIIIGVGCIVYGVKHIQQVLLADKAKTISTKWFHIIVGDIIMLIGALNLAILIQS